jgi:diguanylate cyclase (GGDEF)-like protein/PAS domain S-box-containing protein
MSHAEQFVDCGSPHRRLLPDPRLRQSKLHLADLTHRWNQVALDMVTEPVVFFSAPGAQLIQVNRAVCDVLGYKPQQLRRMAFADIAPHAERGELAGQIRKLVRGALQSANLQTAYRCQDGTLLPVQCSIRALQRRPTQLLVAVAKAMGSFRLSEPCIDILSLDSLTGLPNRAWLWRQLDSEIHRARRGEYRFAVLFLDVDRFKDINDSYGHLAGDRVLQAVARHVRSSVRPEDDVGRFGGDEFVVLMKNVTSATDVYQITRRLGPSVTVAGRRQGKPWRVRATVSIGAALSSDGRLSVADAIDRADLAMYRAKAMGRNGRFTIDDPSPSAPTDSGALAECDGRIA